MTNFVKSPPFVAHVLMSKKRRYFLSLKNEKKNLLTLLNNYQHNTVKIQFIAVGIYNFVRGFGWAYNMQIPFIFKHNLTTQLIQKVINLHIFILSTGVS